MPIKTTAAVLYEMGPKRPYAESQPLKIEEFDLEGPGAGELLIEIAAAGLCHSDLSVIDGSRPRVMPMVLGHEASGIVRERGAGVTAFEIGDHVVFSYVPICGRCAMCMAGRASLCENGMKANVAGTLLTGSRRFSRKGQTFNHHLGVSGYSKYTVCAQESLVKLPKELPLGKAALFGCAVMTGVGAIVNTAKVSPGQSVAVFGMGGVGLCAILGAKLAGANPIVAVDVLDEKLALAKQLGATHAVNGKTGDVPAQIKEATNGGVDFAFEAVGSEIVLKQAYEATRRGGQTVCVGLPHPSKQFALSPVSLVAEERILRGSYMGSCVPARDVPRFIDLHMKGKLAVDALVSKSIKLEEVNVAFDALATGSVVRQVITFA